MSADGYIVTASGNVISKKTLSFGMENINIGGSVCVYVHVMQRYAGLIITV